MGGHLAAVIGGYVLCPNSQHLALLGWARIFTEELACRQVLGLAHHKEQGISARA